MGLAEEIPAPFANAKELALKGGIDPALGAYVWKATISKDGQEITYKINFFHDHPYWGTQVVLIKSGVYSISFKSCKVHPEGHIGAYSPNTGWIEVDKEVGIKAAFDFFKELVENNLI